MTQPKDGFDPNDPVGSWRAIRDANLDAWARSMASMTNSDSFAQMIGMQLDTLLAASAPLQQATQQYLERYLAQMNMPSRAEVVSLAQRLTNIELRLDDMHAQLDTLQPVAAAAPGAAPDYSAELRQIRAQLDALLAAVQAAPAAPPPPAPAAPRRSRKPAGAKAKEEGA